jgi:ribosome-binding factor A
MKKVPKIKIIEEKVTREAARVEKLLEEIRKNKKTEIRYKVAR